MPESGGTERIVNEERKVEEEVNQATEQEKNIIKQAIQTLLD